MAPRLGVLIYPSLLRSLSHKTDSEEYDKIGILKIGSIVILDRSFFKSTYVKEFESFVKHCDLSIPATLVVTVTHGTRFDTAQP